MPLFPYAYAFPLAPLQTTQQSLEVAQEACNDLDLKATQASAAAAALEAELASERARLEEQLAQVGTGAMQGRTGCVGGPASRQAGNAA